MFTSFASFRIFSPSDDGGVASLGGAGDARVPLLKGSFDFSPKVVIRDHGERLLGQFRSRLRLGGRIRRSGRGSGCGNPCPTGFGVFLCGCGNGGYPPSKLDQNDLSFSSGLSVKTKHPSARSSPGSARGEWRTSSLAASPRGLLGTSQVLPTCSE